MKLFTFFLLGLTEALATGGTTWLLVHFLSPYLGTHILLPGIAIIAVSYYLCKYLFKPLIDLHPIAIENAVFKKKSEIFEKSCKYKSEYVYPTTYSEVLALLTRDKDTHTILSKHDHIKEFEKEMHKHRNTKLPYRLINIGVTDEMFNALQLNNSFENNLELIKYYANIEKRESKINNLLS